MWYYAVGHEEVGPISAEEMKSLVAKGTVGPNTDVWQEGMAEWRPARQVKWLLPAGMGADDYDSFTKSFIILDLFLSAAKALGVVASILAIGMLGPEAPLYMWLELLSGFVMGAAGLAAGALLLNRKAAGLTFGWIAVGGTVLNLFTALLRVTTVQIPEIQARPNGEQAVAIAWVLVLVLLLARAGVLIGYCVALKRASQIVR